MKNNLLLEVRRRPTCIVSIFIVWIAVMPTGPCANGIRISRVTRSVAQIFPPAITNSAEQQTLNAGDILRLTCEGWHPIIWNYAHVKDHQNRTTQFDSMDLENRQEIYSSVLILNDTSHLDTGFFTCSYKGTTDSDDPENSTSVYVYFYDPAYLFLPVGNFGYSLAVHPIYQHQESVIPCRPTHPNVTVKLIKYFPQQEVTVQNDDVRYEPRRGFVISFPNRFYSQKFECKGVLGNATSNQIFYLIWHPDTSGPLPPHIDESGTHIVVNSTFTLTCIANVEPGTLLFINWTFPNKGDPRIIEGDTTATDKKSNNGYVFREVTRNLTVKDAIPSDQGTYICTATDHTAKRSHKEKHIKVYENLCHVNLTSELVDAINVTSFDIKEVKFVSWLEAYPNPTVIWRKGTAEIVPGADGTADKYGINITPIKTSLVIKRPRRSDSGSYSVSASVCEKSAAIHFNLNVFEKPSVTLKAPSAFHQPNSQTTIVCTAEGNPPPVVIWKWRACPDPECKSKFQALNSIRPNMDTVTEDINVTDPGLVRSSVSLIAKNSGYYRCAGINSLGSSGIVEAEYLVSDYSGGFAVNVSADEVVDTNTFNLTCGASLFIYTHLTWQWKPNRNRFGYNLIKNQSGLVIKNETTQNSITSTIQFMSIKLNNTGTYRCTAHFRRDNKVNHTEKFVDVKEIRKPVFTSGTNINGSGLYVETDSPLELTCVANGTPQPQLTWLKNGIRLNLTAMPWLEINKEFTKLTIKRVRDEDNGVYTCNATNIGGTITVNTTLHVLGGSMVMETQHAMNSVTLGVIAGAVVASVMLFILVGVLAKKVLQERRHQRELAMLEQMLFEHGDLNSYNPDMPLDDQVELLPYDKRWEFPKERLRLGKTVGQGAFGRVVKAEAIGLQDGETATTVAVKMLKERANVNQQKALMQELKIMIHLGRHLNVVNLLGAVTKNIHKGELLVIVEFCRYGNMRHYLLRHREVFVNQVDPNTGKINLRLSSSSMGNTNMCIGSNGVDIAANALYSYKNSIGSGTECDFTATTDMSVLSASSGGRAYSVSGGSGGSEYLVASDKNDSKLRQIDTCEVLCYAFQIARGMEYLASRKLVHRDLAARNILLADDNVVKICDFGLAKDLYKYSNYKRKGDGPLPIKWMAVESIRDKVFSTQSDVWSFGIVLWELFTLGGNPYPGVEIDEEFYKKLKTGYRMDQPDYATSDVYEIMQDCWKAEPRERPGFTELAERLGSQLQSSIRKYYMDLNSPYMDMNDGFKNNNDYLTMQGGAEERAYVNVGDTTPDYVNVAPAIPLQTGQEYLSMQSPMLPSPASESLTPFQHYDNVRKFKFDEDDDAFELKPLPTNPSPFNTCDRKDDDIWQMRTSPVVKPAESIPVNNCPTDQPDYLFMGKKGSTDSGASDASSGFHSDFAEINPPPSYSFVIGCGSPEEVSV